MKKILVADDKDTGRELVRTVLEYSGHQVFEASDGEGAVAEARRIQPDLIILDIHMPGLDGFQVIEKLRSEDRFAAIPIIALTASAMMGDHRLYHQAHPSGSAAGGSRAFVSINRQEWHPGRPYP